MVDSKLDVVEVRGGLPLEASEGATYSIDKDHAPRVTHNLYKYPTKYVSEIPRWAIEKYAEPGARVLDPFCGSGTTNLEASLAGLDSVGLDVNPFSTLLAKVKTTPLSPTQLERLLDLRHRALEEALPGPGGPPLAGELPPLPNLYHWFPRENALKLAALGAFARRVSDPDLRDFLLVVLARILKRCSYADDQSPKPYVSSKHPKVPKDPVEEFKTAFDACFSAVEELSRWSPLGTARFVTADSTSSALQGAVGGEGFSLVVTSPPYVNAFDLGRTFKFELYWLGFVRSPAQMARFKERVLGTEKIPAQVRATPPPPLGVKEVDDAARLVWERDELRGHVVAKFFADAGQHFDAVAQLLPPGGRYVLVIGDSTIRGVRVPSAAWLAKVAEARGFERETSFSYVIRDRYLRIPRSNRGGKVETDRVVVLSRRQDF
ncbi:MAG: hypothetical protein Kow0069_15350 [Promethearchaeota archaeon]